MRMSGGTTVRRESVHEAIRRLEVFISRCERRYECSSDDMVASVRSGHLKETAEISKWLTAHRVLKGLKARHGRTTNGATTKSIGRSTTAT